MSLARFRPCQPTKEQNHQDRGNQRRPPSLQAQLFEGRRPEIHDERHHRSSPGKAAHQAEEREPYRRDAGVGARGGNRNPQARKESADEDHEISVPKNPISDLVAPAKNGGKPVEPSAKPGPKGIEVELIACRSAHCSRNQNSRRIEPTQVSKHNGANVHNFPFDCCRKEDAGVYSPVHIRKNLEKRKALLLRCARRDPQVKDRVRHLFVQTDLRILKIREVLRLLRNPGLKWNPHLRIQPQRDF
jgi:hypothetical protein